MEISNAFLPSSTYPSNSAEISQNIGVPPPSNNWRFTEDKIFISTYPSRHNFDDQTEGFFSFTDNFGTEFVEKLKEFKNVASSLGEDSLESLKLVDAVLRLGIEYHFQEEIDRIIQCQYMKLKDDGYCEDGLYEVALRFRLFRQQGYHVSADIFNKFKGKDGKFKPILSQDMKGLMEMFEASQMNIEDEYILGEAENFSRHHLNALLERLVGDQARRIQNTLEHPCHKSLARLTARNFLHNFRVTKGWIKVAQDLARMDFKMVQSIHQNEIDKVSIWWNELGLSKELKFARNQPLKWYLWTVACLTDPRLSEQRIETTKPISLIYLIDDIFDIHGTLDELTLFTDAVNKWKFETTEQLPNYLKICFKALDDVTNEIAFKVYKMHGWNPVDSLKKAWGKLCNAFLVEAQWFASGCLPKAKDYLKNAVVSTGVHVVLVHIFFLLGEGITKEAVDALDQIPGIISSTATILRLWDDLGNAEDENQDGQDGSYVECYMKENHGSSVGEAREHVIQMITKTWKQLNHECLASNPFPASLKKASLNAARMVPLMYNYDGNHNLPSLEDYMKSLLSKTHP
ncbi:(3S,6E)-nerolidol synthase 1 [Ziziphus jujuba]|uniref:(3S,6E)-nerolidol synthase 1 n=1 Tax=Ziziphus jujuba TaxID=326968 RepID=A0A6P3ZXR5_ZIZJJ|nr:(3S,6E)-nerolidol synthase 1 [Ziziphus jujuba]